MTKKVAKAPCIRKLNLNSVVPKKKGQTKGIGKKRTKETEQIHWITHQNWWVIDRRKLQLQQPNEDEEKTFVRVRKEVWRLVIVETWSWDIFSLRFRRAWSVSLFHCASIEGCGRIQSGSSGKSLQIPHPISGTRENKKNTSLRAGFRQHQERVVYLTSSEQRLTSMGSL